MDQFSTDHLSMDQLNLDRRRSVLHSPYMEFSKLHSTARYNLATSAVASLPLSELPVHLKDLEITGPSPFGYAPLLEALGRLKGVTADRVVHAVGTSMANHLVMAALLEPGDEVLIEEPAYELLLTTARYLGAKVKRFKRLAEENFQLDPEEIAKNMTSSTRLIVLTNLHAPSSSLCSEETLRAIAEIAEKWNATVLVDEVYLEASPTNIKASVCGLGSRFVVTTSLTKAYGLGGLRCGWIVAEPALAQRIWRLNDLFGSTNVHIGELLSLLAVENLDKIARRAQGLLSANRTALREVLGSHPAIDLWIPDAGTTVFPKLPSGDTERFADMLQTKYETSVVPGHFFECPEHFRIGLGGDTEMTRQALVRLGEALSEWHLR